MAELAEDLRHFQAGEPVTARAPSLWQQVRFIWRRRRRLLVGAGVIAGIFMAGTAGLSLGLVRATQARNEARAAAPRGV